MIAALLVAAAAWIAGYYAQELLGDDHWVTLCVVIFMIAGTSLMCLFSVRDKLTRCPECSAWLRSKGRVTDRGTKIFGCVRCGVDWDSGVQEVGAGEV